MKQISLNHSYTPPTLTEVNKQISSVIQDVPIDEARLLLLVEQRDELILSHLTSLPEEQKKHFAEHEKAVNDELLRFVSELSATALTEISGLKRGLKAVKKYT